MNSFFFQMRIWRAVCVLINNLYFFNIIWISFLFIGFMQGSNLSTFVKYEIRRSYTVPIYLQCFECLSINHLGPIEFVLFYPLSLTVTLKHIQCVSRVYKWNVPHCWHTNSIPSIFFIQVLIKENRINFEIHMVDKVVTDNSPPPPHTHKSHFVQTSIHSKNTRVVYLLFWCDYQWYHEIKFVFI